MSKETEEALRDWQNIDRDPADDLHRHFGEYGRWDWCEISDEARRVWNLMFPDNEVHENSPIDGVLGAVAAQASHGAFAAVAAALGVNTDALELAVSYWYEGQDEPPKPITPEELLHRCVESKAWLNSRGMA